jgi:hypothetical protein
MNHLRATTLTTRTWTITADSGLTASGYLPDWATDDPSEENVPLAEFGIRLSDLAHFADFTGQKVPQVNSPGAGPGEPSQVGPAVILRPSITCDPYADEPERRVPSATVRITDDYYVDCLDPPALAALITGLEAQVNHLRTAVLPALTNARHDWSAHINAAPPVCLRPAGCPPSWPGGRPKAERVACGVEEDADIGLRLEIGEGRAQGDGVGD